VDQALEVVHVGIISNPTLTSGQVDRQHVRGAVRRFFAGLVTANAQMGVRETVIISGPTTHVVSSMVYAEAQRRRWQHQVGRGWGQRGSRFYRECDVLAQLGDAQGEWCERQEARFRQEKPDNEFWIVYL
jgi:hypothetical protein